MIRRDYIMKLVQQLLESLFLLLNNKGLDDTTKKEQLEKFYKDYLGEDRDYYYSNDRDVLISFLETKYRDELLYRIEMLSEIMYQDGIWEQEIGKREVLLRKALSLLLYLDENGNTYSIVRQGKLDTIREVLKSYEN